MRNLVDREDLSDDYSEELKAAKNQGVKRVARRYQISEHQARSILEGTSVRMKKKKIKKIRKELQKGLEHKENAQEIMEKAMSLTGVTECVFKHIKDGKWKKYDKYTSRIEEVDLSRG